VLKKSRLIDMMIIVRHWLILLMVLSGTSTGLAQGFDVDRGEPPPTHSSPTVYRLNSPLFEKYRLLVMPPCRDAVFNECSDWAINLLSHGGFVPVNIRMIENTLFEIKLQSTIFFRMDNLESSYRLPYNFKLWVVFDADTARYYVNFDTLTDVLTIEEDCRNTSADFINLVPIRKIPENVGWIIFSDRDTKLLRNFRDEISTVAELITLEEGYYMCLPFGIIKARLSSFSVNKINNFYIQFFRVKEHDADLIRNIIDKFPDNIAFRPK